MTLRDVILLRLFLLLAAILNVLTALRCYSCSFSYNEMYDDDHRDSWCANESLILYDKEETSKICAPWEKFCVTTVMTINNAFDTVTRDCGERCNEFCESVGYGLDQVSCEECCDSDLCNTNFSVQSYQDMMSKQITGWITPLPGEREWNKKSGLKFPY